MAIIPLQMKLVYRIGQQYGFQLDQNYAKDFLATLGVGITSQFLEGAASKILGGLFGGLGRTAARAAGMSFATTLRSARWRNNTTRLGGRLIPPS